MANDKINSLQNYIRWLIVQYQNLQQQSQQDAYRIVNQETNDKGHMRLVVQIVGKSITFKASPEELAADDQILERFSRKDVRTITYYACKEIKKPKARIIFQEFREKLNKMIFGIYHRDSQNVEERTSDQISLDKDLLNEMSQEEAHLVGYTTASEQILSEKEQIQKLQDAEKI